MGILYALPTPDEYSSPPQDRTDLEAQVAHPRRFIDSVVSGGTLATTEYGDHDWLVVLTVYDGGRFTQMSMGEDDLERFAALLLRTAERLRDDAV